MNKDRFKFRVWDKNTQCYKTLTESDEKTGMHTTWIGWDNTGIYQYDRNIENDCTYATDISDDCFLEQCTGLKDKNGNLIYEGDVVSGRYFNPYHSKTPNPKIKGVVRFIQDRMTWIIKEGDCGYDFGHCMPTKDYFEIVGNVHEQKDIK